MGSHGLGWRHLRRNQDVSNAATAKTTPPMTQRRASVTYPSGSCTAPWELTREPINNAVAQDADPPQNSTAPVPHSHERLRHAVQVMAPATATKGAMAPKTAIQLSKSDLSSQITLKNRLQSQ